MGASEIIMTIEFIIISVFLSIGFMFLCGIAFALFTKPPYQIEAEKLIEDNDNYFTITSIYPLQNRLLIGLTGSGGDRISLYSQIGEAIPALGEVWSVEHNSSGYYLVEQIPPTAGGDDDVGGNTSIIQGLPCKFNAK